MKPKSKIIGAIKYLDGRITKKKEEDLDTELLKQTQKSYVEMLGGKDER